jgi:DNA-binding beta-propeller fold protein YncE/ABC-type spermidine/putrescine transport system permease subunit II
MERAYLEQEAALSGRAFWRLLLWPIMRPAILQGFCLCFVLALNNFSIPTLLQTKVYSEEVWLNFSTDFQYFEALRLSWPLIVAPLLLLWAIHFRATRFEFRTSQFSWKMYRARAGSAFLLLTGAVTVALLAISLVLPLFQILSSPRTWSQFWPSMEAGTDALWNSVLFAGGSALCIMGLTIPLRNFLWPFVGWLFFLSPGVLIGIGLIWGLNRAWSAGIYQSIAIVLIAFGIRYGAVGWSVARSAALHCNRRLIEVIRVFGGNRWQEFSLGEWPRTRNMLFAGFYIIFLFCLWEVETLILIVPPGRETLALRIFNMLHYGHAAQVDALCLWLLIVALAPLLFWVSLARIGRRFANGAVLSGLLLFMAGCSGSNDSGTRVKSSVFKAVQVIGSRGTGVGQFNKPRSVAVDSDDNLYAIDMTGRVQKFSPEGKFLLLWQMPEIQKGKPKGMVRDIDGNIIVVEPHYSRLNHFDTQGHLVRQWGDHGTNSGQLTFPRSAAISAEGNIYVSEYGLADRVQCFSQLGRKFLFSFGSLGSGPGQLDRAEGLGIGLDGSVFVADSCNHRIDIFTADGKYLKSFGHAGNGPGEFSYPYDVRIDPTGIRYVCEFGNHRVQLFDSNNQPMEILGGPGADPNQMSNPWSIDFDSSGNLYIADSGNNRVLKYIRKVPLNGSKSTSKARENHNQLAARK